MRDNANYVRERANHKVDDDKRKARGLVGYQFTMRAWPVDANERTTGWISYQSIVAVC